MTVTINLKKVRSCSRAIFDPFHLLDCSVLIRLKFADALLPSNHITKLTCLTFSRLAFHFSQPWNFINITLCLTLHRLRFDEDLSQNRCAPFLQFLPLFWLAFHHSCWRFAYLRRNSKKAQGGQKLLHHIDVLSQQLRFYRLYYNGYFEHFTLNTVHSYLLFCLRLRWFRAPVQKHQDSDCSHLF